MEYKTRFNNGQLCRFNTNGLKPRHQEILVTLPFEQSIEQRLISSKTPYIKINGNKFIQFESIVIKQVWDKTWVQLRDESILLVKKRFVKDAHLLTRDEQRGYKYILNLDGHVAAF